MLPRNGNAPVPVAQWPRESRTGQDLLNAAKAAYDNQRALTHPRINGAERPLPVGPMISCPVQIQGRTVGAVAVGFGAELAAPAQEAVSGLKRSADQFEAFLRQGSASAPSAATPRPQYPPSDMTRTRPDASALGR